MFRINVCNRRNYNELKNIDVLTFPVQIKSEKK